MYSLMTIPKHCDSTAGILSRTIPAQRTITSMDMQLNRTHACTEIESEQWAASSFLWTQLAFAEKGHTLSIIAWELEGF